MNQKFHQRFNIKVGIEEAQRRFVDRAYNLIYTNFLYGLPGSIRHSLENRVLTVLGVRYDSTIPLSQQIGNDFLANLHALEAMHKYFADKIELNAFMRILEACIEELFSQSEVDLGVRWIKGEFLPSGAPLLDEKLVNDVLEWLGSKKHEGVLVPFRKGLDHFLNATKRPELLTDVITDMYEALEALAKIVTERDKDLSANHELFLSKVKASEEYKPILRAYIAYANEFRHAAEQGKKKSILSRKEVESFIYLTGLFLRLAIEET